MSYPRGYGMPMPQQYPSYGQQQRPAYPSQPAHSTHSSYPSTYSRQPAPYPSNTSSQPSPYPSNSSSQAPYPTGTSQTPYPTSQVQGMSINNSHSTSIPSSTSYSSSTSNSSRFPEIQQWLTNTTSDLTSLIKDATKDDLDHLVNNEDRLIDLVQDTSGVSDFSPLLSFKFDKSL